MNHYYENPEILAPKTESTITKRLYTQQGIIDKEYKVNVCLHD